jgi:hypothetical protein
MRRSSSTIHLSDDVQTPSAGLETMVTPALSLTVPAQFPYPSEQATVARATSDKVQVILGFIYVRSLFLLYT